MTTLYQVVPALNAHVPVNDNFTAVSPAGLFGYKSSTTTGLTWGYYGGIIFGNVIADGTLTLTASATNYVVALKTTGVVSVSTTTTNWNSASYAQLYQVVTGTSTITSFTDYRQAIGGFIGGTLLAPLNEAAPVTLASAATVAIGAAAANTINITGTTAITAFDTIAAGAVRRLIFAGVLTLTYNATSLILPTSANITTAANDVAEFESLGGGNWQCINYTRASGGSLSLPIATASVLGGVKVGAGLAVAGDGTLSASGSAPGTQTLTDFANAAGTTTGLTYGYQAGVIRADNVTTAVAAGTVALTASTTNYVEITGAGVVSANTTGFTSGRFPLCTVLTGASTITTITDKRGVIAVGGVQLGAVNVFTKNQSVTPVTNSSVSGTYTPDASASNNFNLTLTGNLTLANPTNLTSGMVLNFCLDEDATGGRTIAFGTLYKWPGGTVPTWVTTASAKNFFSAYYDGTNLRCSGGGGFA